MKLKEEIEHLGHYLPDQGPIQMFIHHNTLHGFEGKPFFKALEEASANEEWVSLHYVEKFVTFPWRGDTKYLIVRVERQSKPPSQ